MAAQVFLKLKPDHRTVLVKDLDTYRILQEYLLNSGYRTVYETERVGEQKTGMATYAVHNPLTGDRIAVCHGFSAPDEVSQVQGPFVFGFGGQAAGSAHTYIQHAALRTTDLIKLKEHLEKRGAKFLTPIYKDKDSFGPLFQCFSRDLLDDEFFFFEFVQRDYDPEKVKDKAGLQFVNKTVQSLYETKQVEFREWMKTGKKQTFLGGLPSAERKKLLKDLLGNVDPPEFVKTIPALVKALA